MRIWGPLEWEWRAQYVEAFAETRNHRRTGVWIQSREDASKWKLLLNILREIRVRQKESCVFPEMKQVTGCLEEASQGAEGAGNQRGNAILMSLVHFYIQYKNWSLTLLNALKVKVSASFSSERWFMEFCSAKRNSFILLHRAFRFCCSVPCRKPESYWDCWDFSVRINPFLLLLPVNFNCFSLFCVT